MNRLTASAWVFEFIAVIIVGLLLQGLNNPFEWPTWLLLPVPLPVTAVVVVAVGMSLAQTYIGPAMTIFLFFVCTLPLVIVAITGMAYWFLFARK